MFYLFVLTAGSMYCLSSSALVVSAGVGGGAAGGGGGGGVRAPKKAGGVAYGRGEGGVGATVRCVIGIGEYGRERVIAGGGDGVLRDAPEGSGLGVLVVMRVVGLILLAGGLVGLLLSGKSKVLVERELFGKAVLPLVLLAGLGDVTGNVFFMIATSSGALAVAAVLTSLYPVGTILLARIFLKERIALSQNIGIALAIGACALLAAG